MLPKSYRLSRPELLNLKKTGRRFHKDYFSLISTPNKQGHLRLSLEISLKINKLSTFRNRLRRQFYNAAQNSPVVQKPYDVLVILRPTKDKTYSTGPVISQIANLP